MKVDMNALQYDLGVAATDIKDAVIVSSINLLFPLNMIARAFYLNVTGRVSQGQFDSIFLIDLTLFVLTV